MYTKSKKITFACCVITLAATALLFCSKAQAEGIKAAQLTQVNNAYGIIAPKNSSNILVNLFPKRNPSMCRIIGNTDKEKDFFVPIGNLAEWQFFLNNKPNNFVVSECTGSCGAANGKDFVDPESIEAITTDKLCNTGAPSKISGDGPWTWECAGIDGASGASCSAYVSCANYKSEMVVKNDACPAGYKGAVTFQRHYYCPSGHEPGMWEKLKMVSADCKYEGDKIADVCGEANEECKITSKSENGQVMNVLSMPAGVVNAINSELAAQQNSDEFSYEDFAKAVEAGTKKFTKDPTKWIVAPSGPDYEEFVPQEEG